MFYGIISPWRCLVGLKGREAADVSLSDRGSYLRNAREGGGEQGAGGDGHLLHRVTLAQTPSRGFQSSSFYHCQFWLRHLSL